MHVSKITSHPPKMAAPIGNAINFKHKIVIILILFPKMKVCTNKQQPLKLLAPIFMKL